MNTGGGDNYASAIALQPDGKLLIAGTCFNGIDQDFCAFRLRSDGNLDPDFGVAGKIMTAIGTGHDYAFAIVVQPDGMFVLAGACFVTSYQYCAARYRQDGSLDSTFALNGKLLGTGSFNSRAFAALQQPDGKLVLVGECYVGTNMDFCARRYDPSGQHDASFGTDGYVVTSIGTARDSAATVVLQPDGRLVLAGTCTVSGNFDFCAVRYGNDGSIDVSFGSGGAVSLPFFGGDDYVNGLLLQPDGKLLLLGSCNNGSPFELDFCMVRLNSEGALDTSFGAGGKINPASGKNNTVSAASLQPDGKFLAAGTCLDGSSRVFCVRRYHPDGSQDVTFGVAGQAATSIVPGYETLTAMIAQPDGKVVVAGSCSKEGGMDPCVARFNGGPFGYKNCSLDIDGDNRVLAMTDSLIHTRIALGVTGPAVANGITFPPTATRNTWPLIRDYLVTQCGMSLVQ